MSDARTKGAQGWREVKEAAEKAEGAFAQYYAKVAGKLETDATWAGKEAERLARMAEKGTELVAEKRDEMVSRQNILAMFVGDGNDEGKTEL